MDIVASFIASLANYFGAIAQVSGGLVGLMFVALTFNIRTLGLRGDPPLRTLAQQTLSDFLLVLVLSLAMLVPNMRADNLGALLCIVGATGVARAAHSLLLVRRDSYVWLIIIAIAIVIALGLMTAWFVYCRNEGGWPALDMPSWTSGGTWKMYCAS